MPKWEMPKWEVTIENCQNTGVLKMQVQRKNENGVESKLDCKNFRKMKLDRKNMCDFTQS